MEFILCNYVPPKACSLLENLLKKYPVSIKIVNPRSSKHGDFRVLRKNEHQITINNDLNEYQFLLTFIHELAHLVTYTTHGKKVRPHGKEWKEHFQHMMLPFLDPIIFPVNLLPFLAQYLKNPKASTSADVKLTYELKQFDQISGKNFIFELNEGTSFIFKNKTYIKGVKRRTRFECLEVASNRLYLFNQNAEVEII